MPETTVAKIPLTSPSRTGSTSRSGNGDEAEFAASMTAVVTIDVTKSEEQTTGASSTGQGTPNSKTTGETLGDIEIEIEITTLKGDDLAKNLSVTSGHGAAEITVSKDGDIGVSTDGAFFSDNAEVQIGETLTFTVPDSLDNVKGATISVSNLVSKETGAESALVIAYDAEGKEVLRCLVEGNKSGDVTVDIDVSFSKVDFKPVDNGAWARLDNSDFTIDRIDIKTGNVSGQGGSQHEEADPFADYYGFFYQRNYSFQRFGQTQRHHSVDNVFATRQSDDNRRQDDEAVLLELDQREKATALSAQGEELRAFPGRTDPAHSTAQTPGAKVPLSGWELEWTDAASLDQNDR